MPTRARTWSAFLLLLSIVFAQYPALGQSSYDWYRAYVDDTGTLRWSHTQEEVTGFGVNYSVPFAHAYRSAQRMGVDVIEAIRQDVYHFARLGFDLYRLHVWDTEISDSAGNLLENEHLDAFDYLLMELAAHDINYVITPIAYWGNGWPEPDEDTPGFSGKYGKGDCLTDPACIAAQQNYLRQFLNHVNPYTDRAYKDDPRVIAFEVSNEPHHRGDPTAVTQFVTGMVEAMRSTGTEKPIFYNMSHAVHFAEAYFDGGISGGTFQWYPTGLGYQQELPGNLLPNVDAYTIPFDSVFRQRGGAKLVYEFDAADVGRSYIYPVMARSFREAGIQIATHFAYDPTYLAYANTEYNTHYMNLAYTPGKALSLMIASKVFHEVPMYADFGTYPANTSFGNVMVSYLDDVAVYNTPTEFIYTNDTEAQPESIDELKKLTGVGSSSVVQYEGLGAYFLEKWMDGIWRLEVMPDAMWVQNPFGRNSPDKTVGVIHWADHAMTIDLPDLGDRFRVEAINRDNDYETQAVEGTFTIRPGTYLLKARGKRWRNRPELPFDKVNLGNFYALADNVDRPWLMHQPAEEITAGKDHTVTTQLIAPTPPSQLELVTYFGWRPTRLPMEKSAAYTYQVTLPGDQLREASLSYYLVATWPDGTVRTYPAGSQKDPADWDYFERETFTLRVRNADRPIHLFEAAEDVNTLARPWRRGLATAPTDEYGEMEYRIQLDGLWQPDNENLDAQPIYDHTFKHYVLEDIEGRRADLPSKEVLVIEGRSLVDTNTPLQIALVLDDGTAYGGVVQLTPQGGEYRLSLQSLEMVPTVTLPRPYPSFLPYYVEHSIRQPLDITRLEAVQFSVGPGMSEAQKQGQVGLAITRVRLE